MKLDIHSVRANRIQKARHLLHHAGYADGGPARPAAGGNNDVGMLPTGGAPEPQTQHEHTGGKVRRLGRRHARRARGS